VHTDGKMLPPNEHSVLITFQARGNLFRLVCYDMVFGEYASLDHGRYGNRNVERLDRLRETRVLGVLYPRLFGVAWSEIDTALQRMHCNCEPVHAAGVFRISHGTSLGAKLLLLFLRLPPPNTAAQVELIVRPVGESETWLRLFDGKPVVTVQRESVSGLLAERFGPIEFRFRLSFADHTIRYRQVGVSLRLALPFFPEIPLPGWASPRVSARETAGASEMETRVRVEVSAPVAGLLFSYEGELRQEQV
jgi:Domain of unknown function (DUF4166)